MTRILITGMAGFIGSHVYEICKAHGNVVEGVDDFSVGKNRCGVIHDIDVAYAGILWDLFLKFKPEVVIHLAAQSAISTAWSDPLYDLRVNARGTLGVITACQETGVKRLVFASTSAVYSEKAPPWGHMTEVWPCDPTTPYGISKLAAEQYIRTMFPNHAILRFGNVYGPGQVAIGENQVIARAFAHFIKGDEFKVTGHGNQKRDFVFVRDVAEACLDAALSDQCGTFNVASGKSYSVNHVLSEIEEIYGVPGYEWEHTEENDPRGDVKLNCLYIKHKIGWRARTTLEEGLRQTAGWWESRK